MLTATGKYFGAFIAEKPVIFEYDIIFVQYFPKAWPTGSRFEFVTGVKDRELASSGNINAALIVVEQFTGKGALGFTAPHNIVLLLGE